jgi:hypothetical protein
MAKLQSGELPERTSNVASIGLVVIVMFYVMGWMVFRGTNASYYRNDSFDSFVLTSRNKNSTLPMPVHDNNIMCHGHEEGRFINSSKKRRASTSVRRRP